MRGPAPSTLRGATRREPLVSVVVANHDHGGYVEDAVASALAQSYRRLEVVVVDDASHDDSVRRLAERFGPRIRLVALDDNVGQVRAVEAGLASSAGEVVCLLDADDRWAPTKVRRVVDALAAEPEATQVSHGLRTIDATGAPVATGRRTRRRMPLSRGDVRPLLYRWNRYGYGITSGLAYPRWVLEAATPMPEELEPRATYYDTWSTVAAAFLGPVTAVDENLMDYRVHGANVSGGSIDFDRFVANWRRTGRMIDHWAERTGDPRRADVERADCRLPLFAHLAGEEVGVGRRLWAVARTPVELHQVGAQPLDGAIRTAERTVMAVSRHQGAKVKQLGLSRWVRTLPRPRPWGRGDGRPR